MPPKRTTRAKKTTAAAASSRSPSSSDSRGASPTPSTQSEVSIPADHSDHDTEQDTQTQTQTQSQSHTISRNRKSKKDIPPYEWTDDRSKALAECVEMQPCLYDKKHKDWVNVPGKLMVWNQIGEKMEPPATGEQCKKWYDNQRTRMGKIMRKKSGQGRQVMSAREEEIVATWQFLRQHIQRLASTSSDRFSPEETEVPPLPTLNIDVPVAEDSISSAGEDLTPTPGPSSATGRPSKRLRCSPTPVATPTSSVSKADEFREAFLSVRQEVSSSNTSSSKPPASALHSSSISTASSGHTTHLNQPQTANVTTYVPHKANQPLKSKKEAEEAEYEDFRRSDFNPASLQVLDKAYTDHRHFYRLNTRVMDEGGNLKQEVLDIYRKSGETLSYEQLIQGMLIEGEKLLLGGCWLYFTNVEFYDMECTKLLKEPIGRGRICLTNKRVLLLSADIFTDATISESGETKKPSGSYKLQVTKANNIFYQNLPLNTFHSAEMSASVGTTVQSKISVLNPICWGACSCFGLGRCGHTWKATPPMTKSFNRRVVKLGVAMPPWGTKTFVLVYLDPEMSLTTARDFVGQLQYHAPHLQ